MKCRSACAACCIFPSIFSPISGMPDEKPAGIRCIQLADDLTYKIFNFPNRTKVSGGFKAEQIIYGNSSEKHIQLLHRWKVFLFKTLFVFGCKCFKITQLFSMPKTVI